MGADDPDEVILGLSDYELLALRPAVTMTRFGVSAWRFPVISFAVAIVLLLWLGPTGVLAALGFAALGIVPVLWLPGTLSSRLDARLMRRRLIARGESPSIEHATGRRTSPAMSPVFSRRDWLAAGLVLLEMVALAVLFARDMPLFLAN